MEFLDGSVLCDRADIWNAGDEALRGKPAKDSGFQIIVEDSEDLEEQMAGIIRFVKKWRMELKRACAYE